MRAPSLERLMPDPSKCPKCGGIMQTGYISDKSNGVTLHSTWIDGAKVGFFKTPKEIAIVAYRCGSCGFLENYAPDARS
jgi:predicted RNA-binding Zn-ribbon protein involved in translation (DUF1610 family)